MKYKDLIYKITTDNKNPNVEKPSMEYTDINAAKKSVQIKDLIIGVMSNPEKELTPGMLQSLKREIERTLTVLFNSPISDDFSFMPYDVKTLKILLDLFPDRIFHYVSSREEYDEIAKLKKDKINLKTIFPSLKKKADFAEKIDYLVTINYTPEPDLDAALKKKNTMIFPMDFVGITQHAQKEKIVKPDPSGWVYNSASGLWVKNWGWDGHQEIQGW